MSHPYLQRTYPILVMAHRGERGHAPENTMPAFDRAAKLNVDILELDIHATADGVVIVHHDDTIDRLTDGTGAVADYTFAELQQFDAGYRWSEDGGQTFPYRGQGIKIPSLEQLFETYPNYRLNIDIKQHRPDTVRRFAEMIGDFGREEITLVGSFDDATVAQFRALLPNVLTAGSLRETRRFVYANLARMNWLGGRPKAAAFQIPEMVGSRRIVTPRFIRAAQQRGLEVHVWTVNEVEDMQRLIKWGVDGLITDYPARLLNLLGR